MEVLKIKGSKSMPAVDFNHETGILIIRGRLISPSNQELNFFSPIIEWFEKYSLAPAVETRLIADLEYCSSSGMKNLYRLFKMLEEVFEDGYKVSVEWKYYADDDDSKEKGMHFSSLLKLPFIVILHNENQENQNLPRI